MSGPGPYIGSRISLISKAQIRYEGFLFAVDPTKSTVALSQVKSCGTEDRPAERVLAPRDEVYDYIVFRATDIQDLKVSEPPKESEPSKPPSDPAIVSQSGPVNPAVPSSAYLGPFGSGASAFEAFPTPYYAPPPTPPTQPPPPSEPNPAVQPVAVSTNVTSPVEDTAASSSKERNAEAKAVVKTQADEAKPAAGVQEAVTDREPKRGARRGRGGQQQGSRSFAPSGNRGRQAAGPHGTYSVRPRNQRGAGNAPRPKEYDVEFDFESANARFNKEEVEEEVQRQMAQLAVEKGWTGDEDDEGDGEHAADENGDVEEQPTATTVYYNKSKSFFDSISSDTSSDRQSWRLDQQVNQETFGVRGSRDYRGGQGGRGRRGNYSYGYQRGRGGRRGRGGQGRGSWYGEDERSYGEHYGRGRGRGRSRGRGGGYRRDDRYNDGAHSDKQKASGRENGNEQS